MAECGWFDVACHAKDVAGDVAGSVASNALVEIANAIREAAVDAMAALGTVWVSIKTPNLTTTGRGEVTGTAPGISGLETVMSYMLWIGLAVCILSLMVAGVRLARPTPDYAEDAGRRVGVVLMATILLSASAALVGGLMGTVDRSGSGSGVTSFLQDSLMPYVMAMAVVSVLVAGTKMAWEQRMQPGKDLVQSLITLAVVTAAGVPVLGILIRSSDEFAAWIIGQSLNCSTGSQAQCFRENVVTMMNVAGPTSPSPVVTIIILSLVAMLVSLIQIMLMVARAGMLVLLAGILPLSASATNTEMGRTWFKRAIAWLVAWLLYKPAAAIIYATAFQLMGSNLFGDSGLVSSLAGMMLMVLAIFALPALLRFVTPAVTSMAGGTAGGGGGAVLAGGAMVGPAMGAVARGSGSASSVTPAGSPGASGATPSGGGSAGGFGGGGGPRPRGGMPSGGAPAGAGASGSATSGAAATRGASATSGASGAAGASAAAAGPVGMAATAAAAGTRAASGAASNAASAALPPAPDGASSNGSGER